MKTIDGAISSVGLFSFLAFIVSAVCGVMAVFYFVRAWRLGRKAQETRGWLAELVEKAEREVDPKVIDYWADKGKAEHGK